MYVCHTCKYFRSIYLRCSPPPRVGVVSKATRAFRLFCGEVGSRVDSLFFFFSFITAATSTDEHG